MAPGILLTFGWTGPERIWNPKLLVLQSAKSLKKKTRNLSFLSFLIRNFLHLLPNGIGPCNVSSQGPGSWRRSEKNSFFISTVIIIKKITKNKIIFMITELNLYIALGLAVILLALSARLGVSLYQAS